MKFFQRSKTRFFCTILLVLFSCLFFFTQPALAEKQGGILKYGIPGNTNTLDPPNARGDADMRICTGNIFESLLTFHYDNKTQKTTLLPVLAKKWEQSPDGKTWTFYLREGVKFHDGTPFNAEAVKYNIDRTLKDKPRTKFSEFRGIIQRVEIVEDYTVKFHCSKVVGHFLHLFGVAVSHIVSPASVEKYGSKVGLHPTGTGPFKFVKWVPGERVELEKYNDYWGKKAYLDGIVYRFVVDANARINMLLTGELDVAENIPLQDFERLKKTGAVDVRTVKTPELFRLFLNARTFPTNDSRVRQAINSAIDRPGIISAIFRGHAEIAKSVVASSSWGYYPASENKYNPDKAKKLLKEAGFVDTNKDGILEKDGKKLSFTILAPQAGHYPMDQELLLAIQQNLREVGIEFTIEFMEMAAWVKRIFLSCEEQDVAFLVGLSSKSHAYYITYPHFHSKFIGGMNHFCYKNDEMDKLLEAASIEVNPEKSYELYKKIQILLAKENLMINLWTMEVATAFSKKVHGLEFNSLPIHDKFKHRGAWIE